MRTYFTQFGALATNPQLFQKESGKFQELINIGKSRGFGFVSFTTLEAFEKCLKCPSHILDGKEIEVKIAIPKKQTKKKQQEHKSQPKVVTQKVASRKISESEKIPVKHRKVFVGGLPHSVTNEELKQYFEKYGELEDHVVMVDRNTGKPRGFGFVTYVDVNCVDKVMDQKDSHKLKGKWIDCKRATPKEELEAL